MVIRKLTLLQTVHSSCTSTSGINLKLVPCDSSLVFPRESYIYGGVLYRKDRGIFRHDNGVDSRQVYYCTTAVCIVQMAKYFSMNYCSLIIVD